MGLWEIEVECWVGIYVPPLQAQMSDRYWIKKLEAVGTWNDNWSRGVQMWFSKKREGLGVNSEEQKKKFDLREEARMGRNYCT